MNSKVKMANITIKDSSISKLVQFIKVSDSIFKFLDASYVYFDEIVVQSIISQNLKFYSINI